MQIPPVTPKLARRGVVIHILGHNWPTEPREKLTDWGKPVNGLPVRLAGLIFTLPVLLICLLGIAFNWPPDCPASGCADPD